MKLMILLAFQNVQEVNFKYTQNGGHYRLIRTQKFDCCYFLILHPLMVRFCGNLYCLLRACIPDILSMLLLSPLTLKTPITTATEGNVFDIFQVFDKNKI